MDFKTSIAVLILGHDTNKLEFFFSLIQKYVTSQYKKFKTGNSWRIQRSFFSNCRLTLIFIECSFQRTKKKKKEEEMTAKKSLSSFFYQVQYAATYPSLPPAFCLFDFITHTYLTEQKEIFLQVSKIQKIRAFVQDAVFQSAIQQKY